VKLSLKTRKTKRRKTEKKSALPEDVGGEIELFVKSNRWSSRDASLSHVGDSWGGHSFPATIQTILGG
jgi:hypothetical protein